MLSDTEKAYFESLCWEKINPIRERHFAELGNINAINNPNNSPAAYMRLIRKFNRELSEARIQAYIETYRKIGRYPDERDAKEFVDELNRIIVKKGDHLPRHFKGALSPYPLQLVEKLEEQLDNEIRQDTGIALSALNHFINEGKLAATLQASQTKEVNSDNHYLRLKKIYQATGDSQRKAVNLADVLKDEGLSIAEIDNEAEYMEAEGWIKAVGDEGIDYYITHAGIKAAQTSTPNEGSTNSSQMNRANSMSSIDIFISHSSKDKAVAEALINLLRDALSIPANKIRCTSVDGYRLPAGVSTDEQLRREIYEARAFIGLMTPASLQSTYVLFELGARWGARLHLAPVLASGFNTSNLRAPLTSLNSLSCDIASQVHQIVSDIATVTELPVGSPSAYQRHVDALLELSRLGGEQYRIEASAGQAEVQPDSVTRQRLSEHDRNLFARFLEEFPSQGELARFLREHDIGGSFQTSVLDALYSFTRLWNDAEHEFNDSEIENKRRNFWNALNIFVRELIQNSTSTHREGRSSIKEMIGRENVRELYTMQERLNDLATEAYNAHQDLIREVNRHL